jgi:diguanylate cyclase (GGDEF)-like protein
MKGAKILLIADSEESLAELASALSGFELSSASTGEEGVELALAHPPSLVMIDLPGSLGPAAFRKLRAHPATADVPTIFVTDRIWAPARIDALPLGAADFLSKPIDPALARLRARNIMESRRRESRVKEIVESIPGAIAVVGPDGRARYAKRRGGCPSCWADLGRGASLESLAPPKARQALLDAVAAVAKGAPTALIAFDEGQGAGAKHWEISLAPMGEDSTELLLMASDQTPRRKVEKASRRLALADALTKLPNRLGLEAKLAELDAEGPAAGWRSLLFIDMDRFKVLNDTHGHHAGDLMLQEVAARLLSCIRQGDFIARQGGDEFVVVLRNLPGGAEAAQRAAMAKAETIRARLAEPYLVCEGGFDSTPSIGAALMEPGKPGAGECLTRADQAMYAAKRGGKNRCAGDWQR